MVFDLMKPLIRGGGPGGITSYGTYCTQYTVLVDPTCPGPFSSCRSQSGFCFSFLMFWPRELNGFLIKLTYGPPH